jgi:GNAT superfamily N-acetyltransferase
MSNWGIRRANLEDANGIRDCMLAAYSAYADRMEGQSLPPIETDYLVELEQFPAWVAESSGKVIAGLVMDFDPDYATLSNIAVHPQYQGHGLGRALIEFAEERAREKNHSLLRLATHQLLTENILMYEHLGWIKTGENKSRVYFEKRI